MNNLENERRIFETWFEKTFPNNYYRPLKFDVIDNCYYDSTTTSMFVAFISGMLIYKSMVEAPVSKH